MPDLEIGTIVDCLYVSGKVLFTQILLYSFSRHLIDSSGSCLRNSLCISSGPTAEWLDFFMESTSSVRVFFGVSEGKTFFFLFEGGFDSIEHCVELAGGVFRKCFCKKICNGLFTCHFVVCYGEVF